MRERSARFLVALLIAAACGKKEAASKPPSGGSDPLSEFEAELAQNANALAALGVTIPPADLRNEKQQPSTKAGEVGLPNTADAADDTPTFTGDVGKQVTTTPPGDPRPVTPGSPADPTPTQDESAEGCGRICSLAEVACDLSGRICGLATRHVGDARYEDACWNAQRQCEAASDACSDCDPHAGACGDDE